MTINLSRRAIGVLVVGVLSAGVLVAAHEPANKTNVAASESEEEFVSPGQTAVLLTETLRASNPTDLVLSVTAECSILSQISTTGNATAHAEGRLKLYVTIDDVAVPVSAADDDDGRVVFCDRTYQRTTSAFENEAATISDYLETRTANAFNWVALNAGNLDANGDGLLDVAVHAEFELLDSTSAEEPNTASAVSEGIVGNRTLVITPTKAKHDETLGPDSGA